MDSGSHSTYIHPIREINTHLEVFDVRWSWRDFMEKANRVIFRTIVVLSIAFVLSTSGMFWTAVIASYLE